MTQCALIRACVLIRLKGMFETLLSFHINLCEQLMAPFKDFEILKQNICEVSSVFSSFGNGSEPAVCLSIYVRILTVVSTKY